MSSILNNPTAYTAGVFERLGQSLLKEPPSFREFFPGAWKQINPQKEYVHGWHVDAICEHLEAVDAGQIQDLVISIPPRHLKSTIVTVAWPSWSWIERPWTEWIFGSYSADLAEDLQIARRRIMESAWYRSQWGDRFHFMPDQNQKAEFENSMRGKMIAAGVGGSITGKGGDILVCDDPIKPDDAESKSKREAAVRWWAETFSTRLNDKKTGRRVLVAQRTHDKDVTANALKEGGWTHLELPAIAPTKTTIVFPISKKSYVREAGEVICSAREDKKTLAKQLTIMGSRGFNAQYQQHPEKDSGGLFKKAWWKYYNPDALPNHELKACAWDLAGKAKSVNDQTAAMWGVRTENAFYILPRFVLDRMEFPLQIKEMENQCAAEPVDAVVVEDASNGTPLVQQMQATSTLPIIPIVPEKDKVSRAALISPLVEAGKVFLPEGVPWVADFIQRCAEFPDIEHDDDVDAFVYLMLYLSGRYQGDVNISVSEG
jgi:predicted phage terminase large subunit-like protein